MKVSNSDKFLRMASSPKRTEFKERKAPREAENDDQGSKNEFVKYLSKAPCQRGATVHERFGHEKVRKIHTGWPRPFFPERNAYISFNFEVTQTSLNIGRFEKYTFYLN